MPYRIAVIAYPLLPLAMILLQRGPVSRFRKAGAISPETARKPAALSAGDLTGPLKRGVLVSTGDGRYFVDLTIYRKERRRAIVLLSMTAVVLAAAVLWLWPPW